MIKVENISKKFKLYKKPSDRLKEIIFKKDYHTIHKALNDISFSVNDGETLGIIGQNGAGKSTLLKILMGVILPDNGSVYKSGSITGLLELGTGFNNEMSGVDNIYMNGMLIGMSKEEIDAKKEEIIHFTELGDFIYEPIKTYSSGMIMRLAFSIAIHANPKCFLVDEALSVGDAHFQQKCMKKIKEFKENGGSIIFVSHDMNAVKVLCDKAILLEKGKVLEEGDTQSVVNRYNFLISKINDTEDSMSIKSEENMDDYGTYEAKIKSIKLIGEDSNSNVISSGEKTNLSLEIESLRNLESVNIGFMIRDKYGQDIYGINTEYLKSSVNLKKDTLSKVNFSFLADIAPGKYTITVALHLDNTHIHKCFHWIDNAINFEVQGYKKSVFAGVVNLNSNFSVGE